MTVHIAMLGPGTTCPSTNAWMNPSGVTRPPSTSARWSSGSTENTPPNDTSPMRKKIQNSASSFTP